MPITRDVFKSKYTLGVAIGLAAIVVAPVVLPVAARAVRPVSRAAAKASLTLYEKSREALAEVGEILDDLAAEVHAELQSDDIIEQGQQAAGEAPNVASRSEPV